MRSHPKSSRFGRCPTCSPTSETSSLCHVTEPIMRRYAAGINVDCVYTGDGTIHEAGDRLTSFDLVVAFWYNSFPSRQQLEHVCFEVGGDQALLVVIANASTDWFSTAPHSRATERPELVATPVTQIYSSRACSQAKAGWLRSPVAPTSTAALTAPAANPAPAAAAAAAIGRNQKQTAGNQRHAQVASESSRQVYSNSVARYVGTAANANRTSGLEANLVSDSPRASSARLESTDASARRRRRVSTVVDCGGPSGPI